MDNDVIDDVMHSHKHTGQNKFESVPPMSVKSISELIFQF